MGKLPLSSFENVSFQDVSIDDPFWSKRIDITYDNTLPAILEQLKITGRWDIFRLTWKPGDPNPPHIFWDSDTAKFLEAACYALVKREDPNLRRHVEQQIEWIRNSQWDDGYINSYYTLVEPEKRFTNLRDAHELYCAGHLLEAAIAHYRLTRQTHFLNAMLQYVTLIRSTFGNEPNKIHGYPGHEELELALMKLYRVTSAGQHISLAQYFVEERGQRRDGVHFYEYEAQRNGVTLWPGHWKRACWFEYMQAGQPIREQQSLEGHAVRAMYFLCGVSDVGVHLNDKSLLTPLVRLYLDMIHTKMYVTYGIGSVPRWEGFGDSYDLPNDSAFCETCANIGVVFLSHRLIKWDWDRLTEYGLCPREIADVLEGALYNAVGGGVSIDGKAFFYANPLETSGGVTKRKDWFDTSCCPPNVARLFCSLGDYLFLIKKRVFRGVRKLTIAILLYMNTQAEVDIEGEKVKVIVKTGWPWSGDVEVRFENAENVEIDLRLRIPKWATNYSHGKAVEIDGFLHYPTRKYSTEKISLNVSFPVTFVKPNPLVRQNRGKVAVRRGPFIFAMESADNGFPLADARIIPGSCTEQTVSIGGMEVKLLHIPGRVKDKDTTLKYIPYWSWANRGSGDVLVWCKTE